VGSARRSARHPALSSQRERPRGAARLILFSPDNVRSVLANVPSVAKLIPDPAHEGVPSNAFPLTCRKTKRELYRWIANTHYEHLADAVAHLEPVFAAGCSFDGFLTTTSREQFISHTAEVHVAEDLLRRGFTGSTIPRSGQASPDLHVKGNGVDMAVEVYSPRVLLAIDGWVNEMSDLLNYIDVPANYTANAHTTYERSIPPQPLDLNPWETARLLSQTRQEVIAAMSKDVESSLRQLQPLHRIYRHPGTRLVTTVEVEDVEQATPVGPVRRGAFSYPGFSGYSAAGVFRTVVERALRKAKRRQTHGITAASRAQVVNLMGTKIAEDLFHPAHMTEAEAMLANVEPLDYGLDVFAFIVRAAPRGLAAVFTVADDTTLTASQVQALFGQTT